MIMFWPFRGSAVRDLALVHCEFTTSDGVGTIAAGQTSYGVTASKITASQYRFTFDQAFTKLINVMFTIESTWPGSGASANRGNPINLKPTTVTPASRTIDLEVISEFDAALAAVPSGTVVRVTFLLKKGKA